MSGFRLWSEAWNEALYGSHGFYLEHRPAQAFRTAVNATSALSKAIARWCEDEGLDTVVDVGSGGGELLSQLSAVSGLRLIGVDVGERPPDLPSSVHWCDTTPAVSNALVVGHELLDVIACPIVELDRDGAPRLVEVDPSTGEESLGPAPGDRDLAWLEAWWPLTGPGDRAEVGRPRDELWSDIVSRVDGVAVAIDYGHHRDDRPRRGTLQAFRSGRAVLPVPDGSRDITAHVAIDSLAAAVGGTALRQREALARLGVSGRRPDLALAHDDPARYLTLLSTAASDAEALAPDGWGGFWWVVTDTRGAAERCSDRLAT